LSFLALSEGVFDKNVILIAAMTMTSLAAFANQTKTTNDKAHFHFVYFSFIRNHLHSLWQERPLAFVSAIFLGGVLALFVWNEQSRRTGRIYGMPYMHYPKQGRAFPILGQALNFLRYRPWDLLTTWHLAYGPIVCFTLLGKTMFSIADPILLKYVLQSKISHVKKDVHNTYKHFLVILGQGIVTSEDQSWMHQRLKMSQPLRSDILTQIPAQTLKALQNSMKIMDQAVETQQPVPLGESLRHLTLQVISGAFLSLSAEESDSTFAQIYMPIVDESNQRVWHPYRAWLIGLPFWWEYQRNVRKLNTYVSHLIRQRWTVRRQEEKEGSGERENDVLDRVLQVYEKECDSIPLSLPENMVKQFRDEMKTFMLAGHETSAAMMTWAFYELMGDRDRLVEPLLKEACTVFDVRRDWAKSTAQDLPDAEELAKLTFSEATLRESLRKYSVVPIVARRTVKDLYMDNYYVPKGSSILINIQGVHWNPEFWPEPMKFDPERFLDAQLVAQRDPYTFLPFIAGPRNCLGQHLALLESKMVLSLLTQRYEFELVGQTAESMDWSGDRDPRHRFMVPAIPKEELMVKVKFRRNNL
jgi:cytochrome P450